MSSSNGRCIFMRQVSKNNQENPSHFVVSSFPGTEPACKDIRGDLYLAPASLDVDTG
jgi:hypothetical protein